MKPEYRILIINRNADERAAFRDYLQKSQKFNFIVFESESGAKGIEAFFGEKPDCVLLDENLPDASAVEILEKLKSVSPDENFPVIRLLDKSGEASAENAIKNGARNFYFKDRDDEFELVRKIENEVEKLALHRENENKSIDNPERRFRDTFYSLIQKCPFGIYIVGEDFRMTQMSPGCHKAFKNIEPIIGRDFAEILRILWEEPIASEIEERFRNTLATGESYHTYLTRHQLSNTGDVESYDWSLERVTLPDGTFGVVCYFYDLTDSKNVEKALRGSEEKYRVLFESIDEGFVIADAVFDDGGKPSDFIFSQANPSFWRLSGLPEDSIGRKAREVIPGLEDFWIETYGNVALTGKSIRFENYSAQQDRWFDVYASRVDGETSRRVAIVFKNITNRKKAEQERERLFELEQTARRSAEEINRAKDDFLTMLSHELRAPLNAIYGWTQVLQNGEFDKEKVEEAIEVIDRNVRLQTALIEDLLDVSRIVSDKMQIEPEIVSLAAVVQTAIKAISPSAESKSLDVKLKIDTDADEISGDKNRLQQIIDNLLTNAVKFTPEGGEINVALERAGDNLKLSVADNGIGIADEMLPFIFDRFHQADGGSKRKYGGLGLGLTIVKSLVELHGATISVHSGGDGKGTTFTIEFPLISNASASHNRISNDENVESQIVEPNKKPLDGKRILLVDDDRDVLNFLSLVLRDEGAEVACYNLADEALKKLQSEPFDLLISDLGMEPMDGFDLIKKIRSGENESLKNISAIALTGYVSAQDRELAVTAGFQRHLAKPVKLDDLITTIAAVLNEK